MAATGPRLCSAAEAAPYEMWSGTGQDVVAMRRQVEALSQGPHPGCRCEKKQATPEDPPFLRGIPKYTESVHSSFRGGVSGCFRQVNTYFLLALATWKHERGGILLALDPTEVAHCWA